MKCYENIKNLLINSKKMKKICKFVKLWVWALVLGETIASYYKDEKFKNNLHQAKWFDKCKVIFNNLVDVNKKFFSDVKSVDYDNIKKEYKDLLDIKIEYINEKIDYIKKEWKKLNQDKIQPLLDDIQTKYSEIIDIVWKEKDELLEKYGPELEKIQQNINTSVETLRWKVKGTFKNKEK